jgi:hypothetical protein
MAMEEPLSPLDVIKFWVFVDLGEYHAAPRYWIVPNWWMRNDIDRVHQEYLGRHDGSLLKLLTQRIMRLKKRGCRSGKANGKSWVSSDSSVVVSTRRPTLMRVFMPLRGRATARNFPKFLDGLLFHIGSCSLEGSLVSRDRRPLGADWLLFSALSGPAQSALDGVS